MVKKSHERLIAATEINRHLYCARALAYDRRDPALKNGLLLRLKRWVFTPWKPFSLLAGVLTMLWLTNVLFTVIFTAIAILVIFLGSVLVLYLPDNITIYHGTKAKRSLKQLAAHEFGLTGKLDYQIEKDGYVLPVLVKNCPAPDTPHQAHMMQLIAHCLLIAENEEQHSPYGIIRYSDGRTFEIDFDEDSVEMLSQVMDEIEADRKMNDLPPRSHEDRRRCYACRHRQHCDDSLFV